MANDWIDPEEPLYKMHSIVKHVKSGHYYKITGLPYTIRIEANNIPAYMYRAVDGNEMINWVRPKAEMEDGRFILISNI